MIRLWFEPHRPHPRHLYHLADEQAVSVDRRLPALEPFLVAPELPPERPPRAARDEATATLHQAHTTYDGPAWLGGGERRIEAISGEDGALLRIEGGGEYSVLKSGEIVLRGSPSPLDDDAARLAAEIVFGPALLLQLAWRGRFALHASAIERDGQAIAFLGDSGAGKSTVAAAFGQLSNRSSGGWRRVADDILPVVWACGHPHAAPRFPQFKMALDQQYPPSDPALLRLAGLYLLTAPARADPPQAVAEPLPRKEALLALVRHTVASKLFDAQHQGSLFQNLAQATTNLPIQLLVYPHTAAALATVLERVEADLRGGSFGKR